MVPARLFLVVASMGCSAATGRGAAETSPAPAVVARSENSPRVPTRADVEFMQGMIAHHAQALTMAQMVPTHTSNGRIHLLAQRIDVSQKDEIQQMQRWLEDRHERAPSADAEHMQHEGMDHSARMPGMLTAEQLGQLENARGAEFDRLFLTFMISHHEGALVMVKTLFGTNGAGQDPQLFGYASEVDADQRAEIARMRTLLAAPPNESPPR